MYIIIITVVETIIVAIAFQLHVLTLRHAVESIYKRNHSTAEHKGAGLQGNHSDWQCSHAQSHKTEGVKQNLSGHVPLCIDIHM